MAGAHVRVFMKKRHLGTLLGGVAFPGGSRPLLWEAQNGISGGGFSGGHGLSYAVTRYDSTYGRGRIVAHVGPGGEGFPLGPAGCLWFVLLPLNQDGTSQGDS